MFICLCVCFDIFAHFFICFIPLLLFDVLLHTHQISVKNCFGKRGQKKKKKKEKEKKQGTYATISFEQICSSSPAAILKMMLPHMCFPLDFANFFFSTHLWTTASAFGRPFPSVRFRKGVITLEYLFFQLK